MKHVRDHDDDRHARGAHAGEETSDSCDRQVRQRRRLEVHEHPAEMVLPDQQHHRRADGRVLRDPQRALPAGHAEPHPREGVPGEPGLPGRGLLSFIRQEHHRLRGRGNRGSTDGGAYADLEDAAAERPADPPDPVYGRVERSHGFEEALHVAADHRRVLQQCHPHRLYLLVQGAAHGSGRVGISLARVNRRLVHHVHGYLQLHSGHYKCGVENA